METQTENQFNELEIPKRPEMLSILCVLSYIWSGIVLLLLLICLLSCGFIFETINNIIQSPESYPTIKETQLAALQQIIDMGEGKLAALVAISMIMYMTSLLGVVKMWRLQKWGFYIYAGVNILLAIGGFASGSIITSIIAIVFIGLYFINLKHLK